MNVIKSLLLLYLRTAVRVQLAKIRPIIVGVGGSSGKSPTAGFIETILKTKYKVLGTGGKNSETGIPFSILGIKIKNYSKLDWLRVCLLVPISILFNWKKYDFLVAEMGIDSPLPPKNMGYLLKIINPKVVVLTNIEYEHSVYFEPFIKDNKKPEEEILKLISDEEVSLLKALSQNEIAVLNLDDPEILSVAGDLKARLISLSSEDADADFYLQGVKVDENEFVAEFSNDGEKYSIEIAQSLPLFFDYSLILSIAVCSALGIKVEESIAVLEENFKLPPGRASIFEGIKNTTIIDSSYNSSFNAAAGMLDLLSLIGKDSRRFAVIGDMREQGSLSEMLHKKLAKQIIETSDYAVLIGPETQKYVLPYLREQKFPHRHFVSCTEAMDFIEENVKEGDAILVKGSQNTLFLERVVEMLLKDKTDASGLPRRGVYWDKIRAKTP